MRPAAVEPMFSRALELQRAGQLAKAEGLYQAVLDAAPADLQTLNNLGFLLLDEAKPEEADVAFRRALAIEPAAGPARVGLARARMAMSDFAAAEPELRALIEQFGDRELRLTHAYARLGLGDMAAWGDYDDLRPDPAKAKGRGFPIPEWRGEPLSGCRLLIWREQGFGDQLMMARYLPLLAGAFVTYAGRPELRRLFGQTPVTYAPEGEALSRLTDFDLWTLPMSLPARLPGASIPAPPYFRGNARRSGGIGVMWRGNPLPHPERSLSEAAGARLLALPDAVSLAPADSGAADFQDTADLIAGLDVVISVDTSVAHLAGAMGKPLMLLLPARFADWRWLQSRADSPWYPSARIYRQVSHGDWDEVVTRVIADLPGVLR